MQHILDIDIIVRMYRGDEYAEIEKWQQDDMLCVSIETLCDVRRHVEIVFGV
jgi:predicted nucleic acid-binding protein